MIRIYVNRARVHVGSALRTDRAGYVLDLDPESVDVYRFERMRREGLTALEQSDAPTAVHLLDGALALWRGRPPSEFGGLPFARSEIPRLGELRWSTIEAHMDAQLALGRSTELVGTLERLVAEEPYRERLRGQLILALYRGGRQTEALESYRQGRDLLSE